MNRISKVILWLVLGLLLFTGLGALTFPWWAPTVFQWGATSALRGAGFSEARLSLQRVGLNQLDLELERLRYGGITLSNTDLTLDYDFPGLRRGELRAAALTHPELTVDLSEARPGGGEPAVADERPWSERLPKRSPIETIDITNAVIRLQDTDWSRELTLDAQLTGRELLDGKISLTGEGLQAEAEIELQWPDLSGDADVSATLGNPSEWLQFSQARGWLTLPENLEVAAEPFQLEAAVGFTAGALNDWKTTVTNGGIDVSTHLANFSADSIDLEARAQGSIMQFLVIKADDGSVAHQDLDLSFGRLQAVSSKRKKMEFTLVGWELSGEYPDAGLGSVSASAGDLALILKGSWQPWQPDFALADLGLLLRVNVAPLELYTGLGSASGNWQLAASVGAETTKAAEAVRRLSLTSELADASLQASGAGLESERLTLSIEGALPNALSAVFGVTDGHVTWADGGGRLSGLEGEVTLKSLMPPASEGRQTLLFASIEQGDFSAGSGTLRLDYAGDRTEGPPLDIELTTTALGGDVRIIIQGQVSDPLSLSIRAFLDSVQLEQVAALFPQFEGRIEGVASGELALRFDSKQFALLPGELKLKEDTTGRVEYLRQGWLTQDPDLDPEQFVSGRDIVDIMEDPQGATALTELAMRNLGMSVFSLKIEETTSGKQSVVARIEGEREIRGVTVPVVLDIPIRGDVRETINAVFEFKARM